MNKALHSHLSGQIARTNPLEGGPEFDAMMRGDGIVASTWGDYATKLMDLHDYTPEEAIAALRLSPEDLSDPTVHFTHKGSFREYEEDIKNRFRKEAEADLMIEVRRLQDIVDEIMSGYTLPDHEAAEREADSVQNEIDEAAEELCLQENETIEEKEEYDKKQAIRCTRRDALNSGVYLSLEEFVTIMLNTNVTNGDFPSELAATWIRSLRLAVEEFERDQVVGDMMVPDLYVGKEAFIAMKRYLQDLYSETYQYAEDQWEIIRPVFEVSPLEEHPLVKGTEQN